MKLAKVDLFAFLSKQIPGCHVEPEQVVCSTLFNSKILTVSNHGLLTQPGGPPVDPVVWRMSGCFHKALLLPLHS